MYRALHLSRVDIWWVMRVTAYKEFRISRGTDCAVFRTCTNHSMYRQTQLTKPCNAQISEPGMLVSDSMQPRENVGFLLQNDCSVNLIQPQKIGNDG